jgi:hypothetical protein
MFFKETGRKGGRMMNRKLWFAVALVLIGLGYLALQPKGDMPAHMDEDRPASTDLGDTQFEPLPGETAADTEIPSMVETGEAPVAEDNGLAGKLVETLHADKDIVDVAVINSVECTDERCTVELEAKGEENVQERMAKFLQDHPEFGTSYTVAQGENPRVTQFILGKRQL